MEERSRLHEAYAREARVDAARLRDRVQSLETDNQIDQFMSIVTVLQATAFGDSGSLTTTSNLLLLGNQLAWASVDPLMRSMEVYSGPPSVAFKWLRPIGSLATAHLLLARRQHIRFVSGVTSVVPGTTATEALRSRIAEDLWPAFRRRTDVPVTLAPLDPAPPMFGTVIDGELRITVAAAGAGAVLIIAPPPPPPPPPPVPPPVRVAWMIDTGEGRG
jgi:hypothetical protein